MENQTKVCQDCGTEITGPNMSEVKSCPECKTENLLEVVAPPTGMPSELPVQPEATPEEAV